jgi:hypothetical protein
MMLERRFFENRMPPVNELGFKNFPRSVKDGTYSSLVVERE